MPQIPSEVDYIIVGAGSAGCVLADKLSQDGKNSVLLLEAGGKNNGIFIKMPAGYSQTVRSKNRSNYGFETEPQEHVAGRRLFWPRGRGWGGSSSINAMVYIRGNAQDYDHWQQLGNMGWSYEHVLPYFKRAENYVGGGDKEYHGTEGPLSVRESRRPDDILIDKFLEAGQEAGYPRTRDFNGKSQEGVSRYEHTMHGAQRCSTARAYLLPALERENLHALTKVAVDKVLFEGKKASGVRFLRGKKPAEVKARREVILSAGAVSTPPILLRSGVGPQDELKQHGIASVHHLPGVGKNLQDHIGVVNQFACTQPVTLHKDASILRRIATLWNYLVTGTGGAAWPPTCAGGFIKSTPDKPYPDIQFHYVSAATSDPHGRDGINKKHGFSNVVYACRPLSRGYIGLKDADPNSDPYIAPNYFSEEQDIVDLRNGLRAADKIFGQKAFDAYRGERMKPSPDVDINNDAELDAWIRATGETLYHPVGTCMMGAGEMAVTNEHGQVHGVEGLRVVDASLMPALVTGNTNAPTIMMAEKISDHLLGKAFLPPAELSTRPQPKPQPAPVAKPVQQEAPAPAPKAPEPPKPAPAPVAKAVEPPKPAMKAPEPPKPAPKAAEPPKPVVKAVEPPKAPEPPKPAPKPVAKAVEPPKPAPKAPEPPKAAPKPVAPPKIAESPKPAPKAAVKSAVSAKAPVKKVAKKAAAKKKAAPKTKGKNATKKGK